jgi:AGCS family alanine or glycine:cation symporter
MFSYGVHVTDNGKYNVQNPVLGADGATQFYTKEQKMFAGPGFTQSAMDSVFPGFSYFVAIALFFFAFTTMPIIILLKQIYLI